MMIPRLTSDNLIPLRSLRTDASKKFRRGNREQPRRSLYFFDDETTTPLWEYQASALSARSHRVRKCVAPAHDLHTLISSNDLANRLGVSRATVLRAVARGLLKPAVVTPGGHRRFQLDDFADDLELLARAAQAGGGRAELLSSKGAARLLGVSQPTLNRAVREGRLRPAAVTPGGHRRFATSELLEALRAARTFSAASSWSGC